MAKQYKLTLVPGYPQDNHHRAGLVLQRGGSLITELSKDQLEAVKNDNCITLSEAKVGEQTKAAPTSEEQGAGVADTSAEGASAPDRSASEDAEVVEDQAEESQEETVGEDQGTEDEVVEDTTEGAGEGEVEESADEADVAEDAQESVENTSSEESEETVDSLVRDHSRDELNKIAAEAGVEAPELLDNKPAVAQAIIEKRA